jgi:WD40 repeat protein
MTCQGVVGRILPRFIPHGSRFAGKQYPLVVSQGRQVESEVDRCVKRISNSKLSLRVVLSRVDPSGGDLVEDEGQPMRKLIGHSGPVYSLSFDPIYGSASSPQALLSSSQDGTVRLWSLDTYSNLVVYRGHGRDPVWDVEWGPMGVYFATASRDRTARLWSSDRVTPLRMYTGHLSDVNVSLVTPLIPSSWSSTWTWTWAWALAWKRFWY